MEKTYAYATDGFGTLVIGELDINGSVKIHAGNSVWGLSALNNLNLLDKEKPVNVEFRVSYAYSSSQKGKLVIAWNKPKLLGENGKYYDVDNCVARLR